MSATNPFYRIADRENPAFFALSLRQAQARENAKYAFS